MTPEDQRRAYIESSGRIMSAVEEIQADVDQMVTDKLLNIREVVVMLTTLLYRYTTKKHFDDINGTEE